MSYTTEELVKAYTAVHVGVVPPPEVRATFTAVAGGGASDSQILSNILNGADNSTALAVMSYQFFTGRSPTQVGMSYLVNSPYNSTDLNDAYYSGFNIENRYINFAANLGVNGEGAFAFATKYGEMSFADYVASIYQTVIGRTMATTAGVDVDAAIAYLISTKAAVQATVAAAGLINANSTPAQIDLAVKAAMAGLVMAAAIKADIGLYAAATDNFMVALATGTAVYGTDITKTYAPSADSFAHGAGKAIDRDVPLTPTTPTAPADSARTVRLTTGTDSLAGGTANDTFNADDADGLGGHFAVLTTGDALDGGAGNDTLNIVSGTGAALTLPVASVTGIETVNVTGDNSVTANTATWTGVTALNVTSVGAATVTAGAGVAITTNATSQATGNITVNGGSNVNITATGATTGNVTVGNTVAPTGSIVVSRTSSVAGATGNITVNGGTTVDITQVATNAVATTQTYGTIVVNGGATTTSVSVHNPARATASGSVAGVNGNSVAITDKNSGSASTTKSTITSISVDGATTVGIQDNALSTLSVAHTSGNLIIDNSSSLASGDLTKNAEPDHQRHDRRHPGRRRRLHDAERYDGGRKLGAGQPHLRRVDRAKHWRVQQADPHQHGRHDRAADGDGHGCGGHRRQPLGRHRHLGERLGHQRRQHRDDRRQQSHLLGRLGRGHRRPHRKRGQQGPHPRPWQRQPGHHRRNDGDRRHV